MVKTLPPPEQVPEYIQDYVEQMDGYDSPNLEPPPLPGPLERIQIRDFTLSLTDEIEIAGQPLYYINASGGLANQRHSQRSTAQWGHFPRQPAG